MGDRCPHILLPGHQRIGLILTVLIGVGAALAGTRAAAHRDLHSDHTFDLSGRTFDWLILAIQIGIAIVGVAIGPRVLDRAMLETCG